MLLSAVNFMVYNMFSTHRLVLLGHFFGNFRYQKCACAIILHQVLGDALVHVEVLAQSDHDLRAHAQMNECEYTVCICICTYTCVCVCVYIYIYIYIYMMKHQMFGNFLLHAEMRFTYNSTSLPKNVTEQNTHAHTHTCAPCQNSDCTQVRLCLRQ